MADWARIEEIFLAAADLTGDERARFLDDACAADTALRREVESLLASDGKAESAVGGAVANTARAFSIGDPTHAGPYKLVREIGRGGMGAVYLGERADGELTKQVAVKLVQKGWDQSVVAGRFLRERQILAGLEHANIARLLDGGRLADGTPYMVMEFVDGVPLDQYARGRTVTEKLQLFRKICDAVDYAHRKLVVHRDIKPVNVLVTNTGEPKLLDFGIGKMLGENAAKTAITRTGALMLTPDYASPEQIRGQEITTATDVYQLGAVLYELLTGRRPHNIDTMTPAQIEHEICEVEPSAPGFGDELDQIVLMALKKEPARRYPSAREFAADIDNYLAHRPVSARPDTTLYRANKFVRRHRIGVAAAAIVAISIVTGVVMTVRAQRRAEQRFQQVRKLANTFLFDFDAQIRDIAGTTQARELLVKTALEYLDSLAQDARGDATLEDEIATAYMRVGDAQAGFEGPSLGKIPESQASYLKAINIRARRAAGTPQGSAERLEVARVYLRYLVRAPDDDLLSRSIADTVAYVTANPNSEAGYDLLAALYRRQSSREVQLRKLPSAVSAGRSSVEFAEKRVKRFPSQPAIISLVEAKETLAVAILQSGQLPAAERLLRDAIAIREETLKASPNNASVTYGLARNLMSLCDVLYSDDSSHLDRPDQAREIAERMLALARKAYERDPSNAHSLPNIAAAHLRLAIIPGASSPDAAIQHAKTAVEMMELRFREMPNAFGVEQNLATYLSRYGLVLSAASRHAEAMRMVERSLEIRRAIGKRAGRSTLSLSALWDATATARVYAAAGRLDEARRTFELMSKPVAALDLRKNSGAYGEESAMYYSAWAAVETAPSRRCEFARKELETWNTLAALGVYAPFIEPRKVKAASMIAVHCKP